MILVFGLQGIGDPWMAGPWLASPSSAGLDSIARPRPDNSKLSSLMGGRAGASWDN
jgi:hypothetical protein